MSANKKIRQAMIEQDISLKELAEKLEVKPQVLSTKLYRDTMSFNDVCEIADKMNCDIIIKSRDTGKEF